MIITLLLFFVLVVLGKIYEELKLIKGKMPGNGQQEPPIK